MHEAAVGKYFTGNNVRISVKNISREITSESALGIFPGKSVAAGESGLLSVELKINMQVPT